MTDNRLRIRPCPVARTHAFIFNIRGWRLGVRTGRIENSIAADVGFRLGAGISVKCASDNDASSVALHARRVRQYYYN
jgi:hypothetical protein